MNVVLFDLDGTLLDSEKISAEALNLGFQSILGRTVTKEEEAFFVGKPVRKVLAEMFPDYANELSAQIRAHYFQLATSILPYHGVLEMLQALRAKGFTMGIVSSKRNDNIKRELNFTGLAQFFDVIVGQDDTEKHKPDPQPLLRAMELLDADPSDCMYVGDQPTDIIAAHRAGIRHIAATWGEGIEERFHQLEIATNVVHSPNDVLLLSILKGSEFHG